MIDREVAKKQVARMGDLDFFPTTEAGLNELIIAMQSAETESHAKYVTTEFSQHGTTCPKPAEVRDLLHKSRKPTTGQRGCKACEFTGWRPYFLLVSEEGNAEWNFSNKERIEDRVTADELRPKLWPKQSLYEMRERCNCSPMPMGDAAETTTRGKNGLAKVTA